MMEWNRTGVLIVDEAQHLTDHGLDELRCIHDEARIPLVLAGNHSLRHRVSGGNESAFAQLTSRIGPKLDVARTTAADVNALASHYGINDEEAVSWLRTRCAGVGGLRAASHLLTLCRDVADVGEIRLSHLKTAAACAGSRPMTSSVTDREFERTVWEVQNWIGADPSDLAKGADRILGEIAD